MKTNKYFIYLARKYWFWSWLKLMDGFAPADQNGNYRRPKGIINGDKLKIAFDKQDKLFLLVGYSCPWCHRALIIHKLRNLSSKISIIFLEPNLNTGQWTFKDSFFNNNNLNELYMKSNHKTFFRATLPVLIKNTNNVLKIISNESAEIVEILNNLNSNNAENEPTIKNGDPTLMELIHQNINDGVYKCGFARNQEAYKEASKKLFTTLKNLDLKLEKNDSHWINGDDLSISDIYLFPTLIRWELIYCKLFKCTEKELSDFKNLIKWRLNFYNLKGIDNTCMDQRWVHEYFTALFPLNPNQIIPIQPKLREIIMKNTNSI